MQLPATAVQIVVSLALMAVVTAVEPQKESKKSKGLQIGVKKRIDAEKCTIKSKKGDTLHMHYTVRNSFNCFRILKVLNSVVVTPVTFTVL